MVFSGASSAAPRCARIMGWASPWSGVPTASQRAGSGWRAHPFWAAAGAATSAASEADPIRRALLSRRGYTGHRELRDAVAVLACRPEEVAVGLGPLQEEVKVVLPCEADAAV